MRLVSVSYKVTIDSRIGTWRSLMTTILVHLNRRSYDTNSRLLWEFYDLCSQPEAKPLGLSGV
jgi:hypothetical protein